MKDYLYFIKWNPNCLDKLDLWGSIHDNSGGLLIPVNGDYRDLVNEALECNFTVYARYYRFRVTRFGSVDTFKDTVKALDLWIEGNIMNLIVNPLGIRFEDIAKALLNLGFNPELISEEDVEYSIITE